MLCSQAFLNILELLQTISCNSKHLPGNISAISRIIPDCKGAVASPYFAASIPFVASSVILRTNGEPFIVAYEVYADIAQPKIIEHLENATLTSTTTNNGNKDNSSGIAK